MKKNSTLLLLLLINLVSFGQGKLEISYNENKKTWPPQYKKVEYFVEKEKDSVYITLRGISIDEIQKLTMKQIIDKVRNEE